MQPQGNRPNVGWRLTSTFAGGTVPVPQARAWQLAAGTVEGISLHLRGLPPWPYLTGANATSVAPVPIIGSRLVGKAEAGQRPGGSCLPQGASGRPGTPARVARQPGVDGGVAYGCRGASAEFAEQRG